MLKQKSGGWLHCSFAKIVNSKMKIKVEPLALSSPLKSALAEVNALTEIKFKSWRCT